MCSQTSTIFLSVALSIYVAATLLCIPLVVSLRNKLRDYPVPQKGEPENQSSGDDLVLVPRGLLGASIYAIRKKSDAPKLLNQLRHYAYSRQPKSSTTESDNEPA